jgi:hypothetical protein
MRSVISPLLTPLNVAQIENLHKHDSFCRQLMKLPIFRGVLAVGAAPTFATIFVKTRTFCTAKICAISIRCIKP